MTCHQSLHALIFFLVYFYVTLRRVTSLNPIDYNYLIFLLELDRLVKYLLWFEIKFGVAHWN